MKSLIRMFLDEAVEDVNLPKEPVSAAEPVGQPMSSGDFAPPPATPSLTQQAPGAAAMPKGQAGTNTIQKEVLDKQVILTILGEMKSVIAFYDKKFESEDLDLETAKKVIDNFLASLATHANNIANLIGEDTPEEAPMEEPLPELPQEPMPELPQEPMPEQTPAQDDGLGNEALPTSPSQEEYTNPFGHAEESDFTDPSGAL